MILSLVHRNRGTFVSDQTRHLRRHRARSGLLRSFFRFALRDRVETYGFITVTIMIDPMSLESQLPSPLRRLEKRSSGDSSKASAHDTLAGEY